MKLTKIECFALLVPDYRTDARSSAQDDPVVKIHTDEVLVGIGGPTPTLWFDRAVTEAPGTHITGLGLTEMLLGKDPTDVEGRIPLPTAPGLGITINEDALVSYRVQ